MNTFCRIVILAFLFSHAFLSAKSSLNVRLNAKAAILINAQTGAILYEKNAHQLMFPASTTKLITALYALEKQGDQLDRNITASSDAVVYLSASARRSWDGKHPPYRLEFGGTHMGIQAGEVLPLRTLFYGLMLASGNDAANVIAEFVSGDITEFIKEMNLYVKSLGCENTHLYTPHGLSHPQHKTTAYDLAILTKKALTIPFFREVVKTVQFVRPETNKQKESVLKQTNALIKPGPFFYSKAIGVKTGYTDDSGFTLVSAAEDHNRKVIGVILGCEKVEQRYKDAIALFEAAFNEPKMTRTLFTQGFDVFNLNVEGGKNKLEAMLKEDVVLSFYSSEEPTVQSVVTWERLSLPIHAGDKVGNVTILEENGHLLVNAPLFAAREIEPTLSYQLHLITLEIKNKLMLFSTFIVGFIGIMVILITFHLFHRPLFSVKQYKKN